MNYKIKKFRSKHAETVWALHQECNLGVFWDEKEFQYCAVDLYPNMSIDGTSLIAVVDKKIVGFISCIQGTYRPDAIEVEMIFVIPDYQRCGIGTDLFKSAIKNIIKKIKCVDKIELETQKTNKKAIKFYKKIGLRKAGILKSLYDDGTDGIQFVKDIISVPEQ